MKITREADYAVRILYTLMKNEKVISAREIAEKSGITLRFALKILSKLGKAGLTKAKKGVAGGYTLNQPSENITFYDIISSIDGECQLSECMDDGYNCTRISDKNACDFRKVYIETSEKIKTELSSIKLNQF